jgi:lipopolysaccharide/colanic/teichoic acid biosynthesis glycosyltransferase
MHRFLDILLATIAILILGPLFIIVIIILKFTGEGEVFYVQQRVGKGGHLFGAFKFVTMVKNSSNIGAGFITTKGDSRVLPVGRVLRKAKLNEFPQLFNILIGDMSFVGPRPQVQKHFEIYSEEVRNELNKIRPGLTGLGSIFFRDEETILERNKSMTYEECYSQLISPYKGELEMWYIKNKSVGLDMLLITLTIWVVLFPHSKLHTRIFRNLPQQSVNLML